MRWEQTLSREQEVRQERGKPGGAGGTVVISERCLVRREMYYENQKSKTKHMGGRIGHMSAAVGAVAVSRPCAGRIRRRLGRRVEYQSGGVQFKENAGYGVDQM